MPAGYDAEVASLFRDLRVASNLTETDLAARIAAPVEVVHALEQGAIYALPPWPETCRVVNAYGTLLNLDTRPLLRRIYAQLEAGVVELGPKPTDVPVMVPPASGPPGQAPQPPQAAPPAWPNGQGAPAPQQLQVPQPQPPQPQPPHPAPPPQQASQHAAWPGGAPPGAQAAPAWPNGPQAVQAQPQAAHPQAAPAHGLQLAPDGTAQPVEDASFPESGFEQGQGQVQDHAQDHAQAHGQGQLQGQMQDYAPDGAPLEPHPLEAHLQGDAAFPGDAGPEPEKKKKSGLLKWGIGALVTALVVAGLWITFSGSAGDTGLISGFNISDPVLDADDPRSRKADRLPNNFPE